MKIDQKKYKHKVKLSTLRLLEKNDFNYLRTQKLTGVSRSTIKKWEKQFGAEVFSGKSPIEVALKEVDAEMKRNDIQIVRKYYNIRNQILDRIAELVPNETKMEVLSNVLKNISAEITVFDELEKAEGNQMGNILQIMMEKIEHKKSGPPTSEMSEELVIGGDN